jgi:hypothetical protein
MDNIIATDADVPISIQTPMASIGKAQLLRLLTIHHHPWDHRTPSNDLSYHSQYKGADSIFQWIDGTYIPYEDDPCAHLLKDRFPLQNRKRKLFDDSCCNTITQNSSHEFS